MPHQTAAPILLIANKFPPYNKVGSLRWTKLCKYLARQGVCVHVMTVHWDQDDPGGMADITHPNIVIHRIPAMYPFRLRYRQFNSVLATKARNLLIYRIMASVLGWDDETKYWGLALLPRCKKVIKEHGIRTVIATGPPFGSSFWAAKLKEQMPELNLIQDFRDPWADDVMLFDTASQKARALKQQNFAIQKADHVVSVTASLLESMVGTARIEQGSASVLSLGFDPEEIQPASSARPQPKYALSFCHIGACMQGRETALAALLDYVRTQTELWPKIRVTQVGSIDASIAKEYADLVDNGVLQIQDRVPRQQAHAILQEHTYALQLNSALYPIAISTKIFEYGALGMPVVSLNYGGEPEKLIQKAALGYSVDLRQEGAIATVLQDIQQHPRDFQPDVTAFRYDNLAQQMYEIVQAVEQKR